MRFGVVIALAAALAGSTAASAGRPSGRIVFSAITNGPGYQQVYVADLDSGRVRQLTHGDAGGYNPSWSPDGRQIAFEWPSKGPCGSPACSRIWLIAADGSRRRPFTPPQLRCEFAAWSPTGDRIAYQQWGRGFQASIYTRTMAGDVRRLTHAPGAFDTNPVWSPDGRRIVFSREAGASPGNYVMNQDGSHLHRLGYDGGSIESWSPDGTRLTASRTWGPYNNKNLFVVLEADGTGERRLVSDGGGPVWSPDGAFIAFVPDDQHLDRGAIAVIRPDGSGRRRLVTGPFSQPAHLDWLRGP